MAETITLNDGTVLEGHCIRVDLNLFVYLTGGISMAEAFALFTVPDKLIRITENNHGNEHIYDGFTALTAINTEYGNCNLTLRKVV